MAKTRHVVTVASVTAALFAYGVSGMQHVWTARSDLHWRLVLQAMGYLLSVSLAIGGVDTTRSLLRSRFSERSSLFSVLKRVIVRRLLQLYTRRYYHKTMAACDHPEKAQWDLLKRILRDNQDCEYGQQYGFSKMASIHHFRKLLPLVHSPEVLRPSVDRIMDGAGDVLFRGRPIYYGYTSGTTGRNKVFPISAALVNDFVKQGFFPNAYEMLSMKEDVFLGELLAIRSFPQLTPTKDGLIMGPVSMVAKNKIPVVSPPQTAEAGSEANCLYLHALFGLRESNVTLIDGFMSTLFYSFFMQMEDNWHKICDDIEHGRISIALPDELKQQLQKELVPLPKRAHQLRQEFAKGFDGIAKRVWPHLARVNCLATGSFRVYADPLEEKHLRGMRIHSPMYGSTEGLFGQNLVPEALGGDSKYTPAVLSVFFEFLDAHDETAASENRTVLLHEVKPNVEYELVISNSSGLYRYRTGDVIMFKEPFRGTFNFEFRHRLGQMLNLQWEKMSENAFYEAIGKFDKQLPSAKIVDYLATENSNMLPVPGWSNGKGKFYVTFVEMQPASARVSSKDEVTFDQILQAVHELYRDMRVGAKIQQLQLVQVHPGTFQKFKDYLVTRRPLSPGQQFKMPRVIRDQEALQFLFKAKVT